MTWKNMKILLASTATLAIASQVVKKVYKYFKNTKEDTHNVLTNDACSEVYLYKNRELNDVIVFSDNDIRHKMKVPSCRDGSTCESRELNCYKLIRYIKSARETLDVCMYLITSDEIADHLIRLGQKHVLIRIIVDSEMAYSPPSQIKRLEKYSFIEVQTTKASTLMHHKFCVIDGPKAVKRKILLKENAEKLNIHAQKNLSTVSQMKQKQTRGFVMSGSLNWSTQAMVTNYESVIVTSNSTIVSKLETEFEKLWVEKKLLVIQEISKLK